MPVDTGRARASWGHWTPGDIRGNKNAGSSDAVWNVTDGGLSITQGSNVRYIGLLNEGHSKQAPAGFLDRAEIRAQELLDSILDDLIGEL